MAAWVPLLQTLAWVALIIAGAKRFDVQIQTLVDAIQRRIISGSSVKAGPFELGEDVKALERVEQAHSPSPPTQDDWSKERDGIYQANSGLFIAHVIEPSAEAGQLYDIFIYLVRHKSTMLDDIESAEFFFGAYWNNQVFRETKKNGLIGISTTAYGPFLCTCRVKMRSGQIIRLHRYIDFEMGRVFQHKELTNRSNRSRRNGAPV